MSGDWRPLATEEYIDRLLGAGWKDEEIVAELATRAVVLESGETIYPNPPGRRRLEEIVAARSGRPHATNPEWQRFAAAYRREEMRAHQRPTQEAVAKAMGWQTAESVRTRLRAWGIDRWADVHPLMEHDAPR